MAKYVVVRVANRDIVTIGTSTSGEDARKIMREDFKKWLVEGGYAKEGDNFDEILAKGGEYFSYDEENGEALINEIKESDFDWKILDTSTKNILYEPMSMHDIVLATSDDNIFVDGNVVVDTCDTINEDYEQFLDDITEKLVGNCCLLDISFKLIDTDGEGNAIFYVKGDVSDIIEITDEMVERLKSELFMHGDEALEDFAGMDLSEYDDKDTVDNILDEVIEQMPEEDFLRYYRKYFKQDQRKTKKGLVQNYGSFNFFCHQIITLLQVRFLIKHEIKYFPHNSYK